MDDFPNPFQEFIAAIRRAVDILVQATHAVQRNFNTLLLYLGITVAGSAVGHVINHAVAPSEDNPTITAGLLAYEFLLSGMLVIVYAAAQAIAFSRMGREIDRPLWKIQDDREALRRFFPMWLALNVIIVVIREFGTVIPAYFNAEEYGVLPRWLFVGAAVVYIPVGAALMFQRQFEWRQIGAALGPLRRQLPKTLLVVCFTGILLFFQFALLEQTAAQPWIRLVLDVIFGYFDCVIFAASWLICIIDRQNPEEMDFEF